MEQKLNVQLLCKFSSGKSGGGSVLTAAADKLIKNYRRGKKDIKDYACRKFRESGI